MSTIVLLRRRRRADPIGESAEVLSRVAHDLGVDLASALDAGRAGIHLGWKPWTELAVGSAAVLDYLRTKG